MKQKNFKMHFFLYIKILLLAVIFVSTVTKMKTDEARIVVYFLASSVFFACEAFEELWKSISKPLIGIKVLLLLGMFFYGFTEILYFVPIVLLDFIIIFQMPMLFCLGLCFIPMLLSVRFAFLNVPFLWMECLFAGVLYYQEYAVLDEYRKYIVQNTEQEYQLKEDILAEKREHERQLEKSRLRAENEALSAKAEISQALHDKLGHSINGSLYQLEACKAIMDQQPEEGKKILQAVIDNLRCSMDEIRIILRREKPSKQQMTMLQLQALCEECKEKYQIDTRLEIVGEKQRIGEEIWEVILDNTYEAVSNALKYARCNRIQISINILNEVVRCSINDDGIGCNSFVEGMGVQGMKQRVRKLNGYIDVDGSNGFQINMILPIANV